MNAYKVQFELPCEDPFNKVRIHREKNTLTFLVPINYPCCEQLTFSELLRAAERSGLIELSPTLNKRTEEVKEGSRSKTRETLDKLKRSGKLEP